MSGQRGRMSSDQEAFERAVALFVEAIARGDHDEGERYAALAFGLARLAPEAR
jgi:hypothetical protein